MELILSTQKLRLASYPGVESRLLVNRTLDLVAVSPEPECLPSHNICSGTERKTRVLRDYGGDEGRHQPFQKNSV